LEGRIRQLSVPTLERRTDGWEILRQGFSKLGFDNPAQRASKYPRDQRFKQDLEESVTAAFRAADGLPKHINELGSRICQNSIGRISASRVRTSISKADIEKSSREMLQEHYGHVKDKFPKIRRIVEKHVEIRLVLQAVYGMGVNTIHHFDSLCERVKGDLDEEAVRFALDKLVELDLFSRTGRSGEVIFANDPTLMHTLGVVCSAPQEFGESAERFGFLGQLSLPFPVHQTA